MGNQVLISIDIQADFGFFKKPDVNDGIVLSYNMLHKPALLGMLGAVLGLRGYTAFREVPEYYERLKDLPVGIAPLAPHHEKGNFKRTVIQYTHTVGYANTSTNGPCNLIIAENTLIHPAYRVYLLLDRDQPLLAELYDRLHNGQAVYVPYMGKNEFQAWFGNFQVYEWQPFTPATEPFRVDSLFIREYSLSSSKKKPRYSTSKRARLYDSSFAYFERLPADFYISDDRKVVQYNLAEFAFSDWFLENDAEIPDLYQIQAGQDTAVIQLN